MFVSKYRMTNHFKDENELVALYKQHTENIKPFENDLPQNLMIQNTLYSESVPMQSIVPVKPIQTCFNHRYDYFPEQQVDTSIVNFSNIDHQQEPAAVLDQSFPISLQGNPFLECQGDEQEDKNQVSLEVCSVKGNYLCSPENIFPHLDQMVTSQTSQFMKMYEFQNSSLYTQEAQGQQKPKLKIFER